MTCGTTTVNSYDKTKLENRLNLALVSLPKKKQNWYTAARISLSGTSFFSSLFILAFTWIDTLSRISSLRVNTSALNSFSNKFLSSTVIPSSLFIHSLCLFFTPHMWFLLFLDIVVKWKKVVFQSPGINHLTRDLCFQYISSLIHRSRTFGFSFLCSITFSCVIRGPTISLNCSLTRTNSFMLLLKLFLLQFMNFFRHLSSLEHTLYISFLYRFLSQTD